MTLEKKHFYTWCAGLIVHALLTIYIVNVLYTYSHREGGRGGGWRRVATGHKVGSKIPND